MALIPGKTIALALGVLLAGCATSSHVLIGTPRTPISPELVKVYQQPPAKYEQIATIDATSRGSLTITSQQNMDKAIARLKQEAARLGANGTSLGGSFGVYSKAARGLAIYVPE